MLAPRDLCRSVGHILRPLVLLTFWGDPRIVAQQLCCPVFKWNCCKRALQVHSGSRAPRWNAVLVNELCHATIFFWFFYGEPCMSPTYRAQALT